MESFETGYAEKFVYPGPVGVGLRLTQANRHSAAIHATIILYISMLIMKFSITVNK